MPLVDLQQKFITFLHGEFADDSTRIRDDIVDGGQISRDRRLHIYHYAYRARLVEVMQDVFERTWAYLGDAGFESVARAFIEAMPSTERTLNRFGEKFPAWLSARFPDDTDISEVALIDWMLRCAFDGADAIPITMRDISSLTSEAWATVGFEFHPTTALAPITYNAAGIWEALEQGLPPPGAKKRDVATFVLVWRKELKPHFVSIGSAEAEAIALLRNGESFASACHILDSRYPNENIVETTGYALRRWLDEGMLVGARQPS